MSTVGLFIGKCQLAQSKLPAVYKYVNTVKPVYNDHPYDKIYCLWFIQ